MPRILVVYYSRTGNTRQVAEHIANALDADVEAIQDPTERRGLRGWLRSAFEATTQRCADIGPAAYDPGVYDLVVIGTPVWGSSMSSPVRSYVRRHHAAMARVAFFCTCGRRGRSSERVFAQLTRTCRQEPVTTLVVPQAELPRAAAAATALAVEVEDALRPPVTDGNGITPSGREDHGSAVAPH